MMRNSAAPIIPSELKKILYTFHLPQDAQFSTYYHLKHHEHEYLILQFNKYLHLSTHFNRHMF